MILFICRSIHVGRTIEKNKFNNPIDWTWICKSMWMSNEQYNHLRIACPIKKFAFTKYLASCTRYLDHFQFSIVLWNFNRCLAMSNGHWKDTHSFIQYKMTLVGLNSSEYSDWFECWFILFNQKCIEWKIDAMDDWMK